MSCVCNGLAISLITQQVNVIAVVTVLILLSIPHSTTGTSLTPEYKSVNTNQVKIIRTLKCNEAASKTLKQKFKEKNWLELTDDRDEEGLVILILNRIDLDVHSFEEFISILKDIAGMDLIVQLLEGVSITYLYFFFS